MNCFVKQLSATTKLFRIDLLFHSVMPVSNAFKLSSMEFRLYFAAQRCWLKFHKKNFKNQRPFSAVVSSNWCWYHSWHQLIELYMSYDWVFHSVSIRDPKYCVIGISCPFSHPERTHICFPCSTFVLKHASLSMMQTLWPLNPWNALQCTFKRTCCCRRGLDQLFWSTQQLT